MGRCTIAREGNYRYEKLQRHEETMAERFHLPKFGYSISWMSLISLTQHRQTPTEMKKVAAWILKEIGRISPLNVVLYPGILLKPLKDLVGIIYTSGSLWPQTGNVSLPTFPCIYFSWMRSRKFTRCFSFYLSKISKFTIILSDSILENNRPCPSVEFWRIGEPIQKLYLYKLWVPFCIMWAWWYRDADIISLGIQFVLVIGDVSIKSIRLETLAVAVARCFIPGSVSESPWAGSTVTKQHGNRDRLSVCAWSGNRTLNAVTRSSSMIIRFLETVTGASGIPAM